MSIISYRTSLHYTNIKHACNDKTENPRTILYRSLFSNRLKIGVTDTSLLQISLKNATAKINRRHKFLF